MKEDLEAFHKALDDDKGLKSKRQLVTYLSLVILAINLSGATIKEANTFLFKIEFIKPEGLNVFLSFALLFCVIRYFNYSYKYSVLLSKFWKSRFMSDHRVLFFDGYNDSYDGILAPVVNRNFSSHYERLQNGEIEDLKNRYVTSLIPFNKVLRTSWTCNQRAEEEQESLSIRKEINIWKLFELITREYPYRLNALFCHRESLDLRAPFLLAALAYISIFEKDRLPTFIAFFV